MLGSAARLKLVVANSVLGAIATAAAVLQTAGEAERIDADHVFCILARLVPSLELRRAGCVDGRHEPAQFALRDLRKDLDLALDMFHENADVPVTTTVRSRGDAGGSATVHNAVVSSGRGASRSGRRLIGLGIGTAVIGLALATELRKPADERTWHGRIAGRVPYDLRPPTIGRVRERLWNSSDPHLLVPTVFGVGWTVNAKRLLDLGGTSRAARTDQQ